MNVDLATTEHLLAQPAVAGSRNRSDRLIYGLIAIGMLASFMALLSMRQATMTQESPDQMVPADVAKSQLYYAAHALEIASLLAAGVLSLLATDFRKIKRGYLFRLLLMVGAALFMARVYTFSDLLSTRIVDWTGPVPFLLSVLVFIGAQKGRWPFLGKLMGISAGLLSVVTLFSMATLQSFTRQEGVARLGNTLNDLYWPASWIALTEYSPTSIWRHFRFAPMMIYILGSLFTQTRLNFVMILSLLGVYGYLQFRRRKPQAAGWILIIAVISWVALFTALFLANSRGFEKLDSVVAAFSARLDEDTRSGQLVSFAQDVKPQELLIGRGSFATWYWGMDYSGGTDVGYLSLLLFGGLPLLLTYFATHLSPGLGVLKRNVASWQLTAAGVVFLWSIRLFSSDYPAENLGYYLVLFCVGACIYVDPLEQVRSSRYAVSY